MKLVKVQKNIKTAGELIEYLQTVPKESEVFIHGMCIDSIIEDLEHATPLVDIRGE